MFVEPSKRDWLIIASSIKVLPPIKRTLSDYIIHVVSEEYGIPKDILLGKERKRIYSRPRQMVMYLLRNLTKRSYPAIGKVMGKDHTTVLHGVRAVERRASKDKDLAAVIVALEYWALDLHSRG